MCLLFFDLIIVNRETLFQIVTVISHPNKEIHHSPHIQKYTKVSDKHHSKYKTHIERYAETKYTLLFFTHKLHFPARHHIN